MIPRFIQRALDGEDITLFGDGTQTRDFVYVGDVVAAALACAARPSGAEIVNVASGQEVSVRDLAARVVRLSGSASAIHCRPRPPARDTFEVERCFGSRDKLVRLTGAGAPTSLDEGLRHTVAAIKDRRN